jgi:hypothetical protein
LKASEAGPSQRKYKEDKKLKKEMKKEKNIALKEYSGEKRRQRRKQSRPK